MGVILYVMLSGCHPFDGDSVTELFSRIENLEFKYPSYFSKGARSLLDKIIVVDPKKRATLEDILDDPWFKKKYVGYTSNRKSINFKDLSDDEIIKNAVSDVEVENNSLNNSGMRVSVRFQNTEQ
jgi:carbon catabolite-derepressing protein kinase